MDNKQCLPTRILPQPPHYEMKTQEIIEYHLYPVRDDEPRIITDSYEKAQSYFDKGWFVDEFHTMKWQPTPVTRMSSTVATEWQR